MKTRMLMLCLGLLAGFVVCGQETRKAANGYKSEAPKTEVETIRYEWRDAKRDRKVPAKIYFPKSGKGPFPVIIFSHGLGGSRDGYEYLGRDWASRGYVSVHLQHLGSDDSVWRDVGLGERMGAMRRAAASPANALNRPRDVSFAIDELEKLNREEKSPFHKKLDLERIGVAGHSFGAYTTLAIAGQIFLPGETQIELADPRVKAAIPMSAPVQTKRPGLETSFAKIKIPCFHMTGTKDTSPIGDTKAEERRLPFDYSNSSDQFLIVFQDGDHMIFSGRERVVPSKQDEAFQKHISTSAAAFWDAYLKDDAKAKAWLTNDFKSVLGKDGVFEMKVKK